MSKKPDTSESLEAEWVALNPRPYWTPEWWAACRPNFDTEEANEPDR